MSIDRAVAIVGIGCRYPGGIADARTFWQALAEGRDAIGEIPRERIDLERWFDPRPATPGRMMTRRGGFLERIEDFDAGFFGIAPREAERIDPQQRLLLETAWEAIEDAGVDANRLVGSRTGVFVGQWLSDFEGRACSDAETIDFLMTTGSGRYGTAGRLSYLLGLQGPSLTLDTACSSSLVAVHLAVRSLRSGESTLALAGGVNVILQPHISVAYSQSRMMAPDGRCKFGDAAGDGYVRSEGAGVVALKTLACARADGDRIYAVIRGSATNNDGRGVSMGTPSRDGQEALLRLAYGDAGIAAARVGCIEAHGTGTRAGDPVEIDALGRVLGPERAADHRCWIGSLKTNIGHTESAAGVGGLIKAALVLHEGAVPASLHFRVPNPQVAWHALPFDVPTALQPWPARAGEPPRVAGVSSFGITGTNAHIVLEGAESLAESAPDAAAGDAGMSAVPTLLPLSARSPEALRALAGSLATLLETPQGPSPATLGAALARRRTPLEQRAAFVGGNRIEVVEALRAFATGAAPAFAEAQAGDTGRPRIAFVVPGQGAQWTGMARALLASSAPFRTALEACDTALRPWAEGSIVDQLARDPADPAWRLDRIDVLQPTLVALAIAYAAWLKDAGIEPDAIVGHSMGEVAAAHLAGVLDLDRCMRIVARRSALMQRTSGQGAMALVDLSLDDMQARLGAHAAQVSVAVSNSPRSCVISGAPQAVAELLAGLDRDGVFNRRVNVDVASHSPQMEPLAAELAAELADLRPAAATLPLVSTVTGARCDGLGMDGAYWGRNLREPVRFADAARVLLDDDVSVFIELSPHALLTVALQQNAQAASRTVTALACGRRDETADSASAAALASLWVAGVAPDWARLFPDRAWSVALPACPWQRERHWIDAADGAESTRGAARPAKPAAALLDAVWQTRWQALPPAAPPVLPSQADAPGWLFVCDDPLWRTALTEAAAGRAAPGCRVADLAPALAARVAAGARSLQLVVLATRDDADAAHLPVAVVQALGTPPAGLALRLWFVTRGASHVDGHDASDARVAVWQAALWGAARVVAEEHPAWWGGLVDLDPSAPPQAAAGALLAHLAAPGGEDQTALRGAQRFGLRLQPQRVDRRAAAPAWRPDASVLITGGQGGIGLRLARRLVDEGVRHLVLLGRTPLPPREQWAGLAADTPHGRRVAAIRAIEAAGASVLTVAADVADEAALRAALARHAAEGRPPIHALIHAAGSFANALAGTLSRAAFDAVVGPKLGGALLLDELLPALEVCVLFSSTGAFLAQPGQANYAAANAGLDALALDRRARGLPALAIGWGVWEGTGLVADDAGARNVAEMKRQGIGSLEPDEACTLFGWLRGRDAAQLAVLPVDAARFVRARAGRIAPFFAAWDAVAREAPSETSTGDGTGLAARLAAAPPAERRRLLDGVVREALGTVLKIAPARIDARKALGAMGLGSLMAVELRNRLETVLERPLSATLAWNHPSVDALVAFLAGSADAPAAPPAIVASTAAPESLPAAAPLLASVGAALDSLAALSDDEAALALLGRKGKPRR